MSKAFLKVGDSGRFAVTNDKNPKCKICDKLLKNKELVFWCDYSKELVCDVCMREEISHSPKSINHYLCSGLRIDHEDKFCVLEIK